MNVRKQFLSLLFLTLLIFIGSVSHVDAQVASKKLKRLGGLPSIGVTRGVDIFGDYAVISNDLHGLTVIDISDPYNLETIGSSDLLLSAGELKISNDGQRIISTGNIVNESLSSPDAVVNRSSIIAFDWSRKDRPVVVGTYTDYPNALFDHVELFGNYIYASGNFGGLYVLRLEIDGSITYLNKVDTPGRVSSSEVVGTRLVVSDGNRGIKIYDISNPESPSYLGEVDTLFATKTATVGNLSYLKDGRGGLRVYDISNPSNITQVGPAVPIAIPGGSSLAIHNGRLYLSENGAGSRIYSLADPHNPAYISSTPASPYYLTNTINETVRQIVVRGDFIYAAAGGFAVANISNPASPTYVDSVNEHYNVNRIVTLGQGRIISTYSHRDNQSQLIRYYLGVLNSNNGNLEIDGQYELTGPAAGIHVSGNLAYVALHPGATIGVFDISNPLDIRLLNTLNVGVSFSEMLAKNNALYLLSNSGIVVVDTSIPSNPRIHKIADDDAFIFQGVVSGDYLYTAGNIDVRVYKIQDPLSPIQVNRIGDVRAFIGVNSNHLFVQEIGFGSSYDLSIYDISTPESMVLRSKVNPISTRTDNLSLKFTINSDYLYGSKGYVMDISNLDRPFYTSVENVNGLRIKSEGNKVFLTNTSDNVGLSVFETVNHVTDPLRTVTVTSLNPEMGSFRSSGMSCNSTNCTNIVPVGAARVVEAKAESGHSLNLWNNCPNIPLGTPNSCVLSGVHAINSDINISASFQEIHSISLSKLISFDNTISIDFLSSSPIQNSIVANRVRGTNATVGVALPETPAQTFLGFIDCPGVTVQNSSRNFTCDILNIDESHNILSMVSNISNDQRVIVSPKSQGGGIVSPNTPLARNISETTVITATPDIGYHFLRWEGCPLPTGSTCVVSSGYQNRVDVEAIFEENPEVTITLNKTGVGIVGGLDCDNNVCTKDILVGQSLDITATPVEVGGTVSWTNCPSVSGNDCSLSNIQSSLTLNVGFSGSTPQSHLFLVEKSGDGYGTLTLLPSGESCDSSCNNISRSFNSGETVTVIATPDADSLFAGFSGDCTGATCVIANLDSAKNIVANFEAQYYTLDIDFAGDGVGTVSGPGITCGRVNCSGNFAPGEVVPVTIIPGERSIFVSDSELCPTDTLCNIPMTEPLTLTVVFDYIPLAQYTLDDVGVGQGQVRVTELDGNLNVIDEKICNFNCGGMAPEGGMLIFESIDIGLGDFVGWGGDGASCGNSPTCSIDVEIGDSINVQVIWDPEPIVTDGRASVFANTVGGSPIHINYSINGGSIVHCFFENSQCNIVAPLGSEIALTAHSNPGTEVDRIEVQDNLCSNSSADNQCTFTMSESVDVDIYYSPIRHGLTVDIHGSLLGGVSAIGLSCNNGLCTGEYDEGEVISILFTPNQNGRFRGWGGDCSGFGECQITMNGDRNVTAAFVQKPPESVQLTVSKMGSGEGLVWASTGGVSCGDDCFQLLAPGVFVTLTATSDPGHTFDGWSGGVCTGTGPCSFTISSDTNVVATFSKPVAPGGNVTLEDYTSIPGLHGLWRFEETGASAIDESGFGNTGSIEGSPNRVEGRFGNGLQLNGLNQRINVGAITHFSVSRGTLSLWLKTEADDSLLQGLIVRERRFGLFLNNNRPGLFNWTTGWHGSTEPINDGNWHHVACSFEHFGLANCYVDGEQVVTDEVMGATSGFNGLGIGDNMGQSQFFEGVIDEVAIYNRILEPNEIEKLMGSGGVAVNTLTVSGSEGGVVVSNIPGIDCGNDCSETYDFGSYVELSANPIYGYRFVGWSGDCSGLVCALLLTEDKNVSAIFSQVGSSELIRNSVAYFDFEGGFGDKSLNGNVMSNNNIVLRNDEGNTVAKFNGENSSLGISDSDLVRLSDDMTLSMWINIQARASTRQSIVRKGEGNGEFEMWLEPLSATCNVITFTQYSDPDDDVVKIDSDDCIFNNRWYHTLVIVEDNQAKFYLDGRLMFEKTRVGSAKQTSESIVFGKSETGHYFEGEIDNFGLFNRALGEDEIGVFSGLIAAKEETGFFAKIRSFFNVASIILRPTKRPSSEEVASENVVKDLPTSTKSSHNFDRNLRVGSRGQDVKELQIFLNENGFTVSDARGGSPGNETTYFGNKTKKALIRYQNTFRTNILTPVGLTQGTGFFGPSTRSFINSI